MDNLWLDLRYAARSLARNPGFAAVAVLCLALGIGANTTMFGVVDTLLFRPPAYVRDPDQVVRIYFSRSAQTSFPNYEDLAGDTSAFSHVAAYWPTEATLGRGPEAQQLAASLVTASFFPLLGARPATGRFFSQDEDRGPGSGQVAVLGYGLWHRQFGGKQAVLGRTLWIGGGFYTVVGVAPSGFTGADLRRVDVWLPIRTSSEELGRSDWLRTRRAFWVSVLGRLRAGVTKARAAGIATAALRRGNVRAPDGDSSITASLYPILRERGPAASEGTRSSTWVAAAAALVLLIACANLAGLLLARGAARGREMAVRLALGAGRGRLVSQLLGESLLLALGGGALAVLLALWGGSVLRTFLLPEVGSAAAVLNGRVLAFTACVALLTGILCGVVPALQASRSDLGMALRSSGREWTLGSSRSRSLLIVGQVALTLVLLVGTGLFLRSMRNVRARAGALDVDKLLMVRADLQAAGYAGPDIELLYQRMRERVLTVPGVARASLALTAPFSRMLAVSFDIPGRTAPWPAGGATYINAVGTDWFATMGTAIARGRGFTEADRAGAPRVAVVSQAMARAFWPGESAIGKCLKIYGMQNPRTAPSPPCTEVVGVAADALRLFLREQPEGGQYYVPLEQSPMPSPPEFLLVRTSGNPGAMGPAIRRALQDIAPNLPFVAVQPLASNVTMQLRPWRMGTAMFGLFAVLGLSLASVGLYGVLAFSVTRRTPEMAVRIALGAEPRSVRWLVVRQALTLAAMGIAIGVPCAVGLGRAVASLLYGVSAWDIVSLSTGAAVLLVVAVVASYLPARRATRVDPAQALRAE